jgi:TPR repeat protein
MRKRKLSSTLWAAILGVAAQCHGNADDHPGLTPADEAYSSERYEEAAALYRRDAELGIVAAQVNLAFMYMDGQGVAQDYEQAATWFRRAADQGNAEAQQNLGLLYQEGKGVAQDLVEADKWFTIAGAAGNAAELEKNMTQEQVAEAKKLAKEWVSRFKGTEHP